MTREAAKDIWGALAVFGVALALYGFFFNQETTLSHSIGYSLYPAERILAGAVPYRDFHTLYPPAIVYLNAFIFRCFGVTLYHALFAVMIFKSITVMLIFCCARQVMPRGWAAMAALCGLFWLRPNGGFKAVPMHYGGLFLAIALFLLLRYLKSHNATLLWATGAAIGALALFKHNIGAYALLGSVMVVGFDRNDRAWSLKQWLRGYRQWLKIMAGMFIVLLPVCVLMQRQGALLPMLRTLLFGSGDFLFSRLAATPSPLFALLFIVALFAAGYLVGQLKGKDGLAITLAVFSLLVLSFLIVRGRQSWIDSLIFYAPMIASGAGLMAARRRFISGEEDWRRLFAVTVTTGAAFMEAFPRFAREQAIGAMPFVVMLLLYLIYLYQPRFASLTAPRRVKQLAVVALPLLFVLMSARLFYGMYFERGWQLKSQTELTTERGRRVFFPRDKAQEIDEVTRYVQEAVPPDGYFFAQSYTGSSYLFFSARNNPSGAQFWGGVGVRDEERAMTLRALDETEVKLILTSNKDLEAEKYEPMRRYISNRFALTKQVGEVVILVRQDLK